MQIDIDVVLEYELCVGETVLLILEAAETDGQSIASASLEIPDATLQRIDGEGLVGQRVWASVPDRLFKLRYRALVDVTREIIALDSLDASPLTSIPSHIVTYLRPSRFCQSDLFIDFVAQSFGELSGGAKIAAIKDWVAREISYVPGSSNATTTATDTFAAQAGVCRDFAHVVCSLARAANIPARYASVYGF
mgnify:FL=1